jgi:CHAD domain-containing protein
MGKKEQKAACVFGAAFMLKQLQNLEKDLDEAINPKDIEPIHRLRVSSRRLRTGIKHFRDCLPEKKTRAFEDEIRRLAHTLGKARDLDIQIETLNLLYEDDLDQNFKPGYRRLLLRLKQSRMKAQNKIEKTLAELQDKSIIKKMRKRLEESASSAEDLYLYTPSLYQRAFAAINADLNGFLSYEEFVHAPENIEKLHAMRIAGKHLRYSLEIFAPVYKDSLIPHIQVMKDIQEQLGMMHDDDVWVNWLPKFLEKEEKRVEDYFGNTDPLKPLVPGINHLIEDRKESREAAYQSFVATWETIALENAWENLRGIIHAPVNVEAALTYLAEEEIEGDFEEESTTPSENQDTFVEIDPGSNLMDPDQPPSDTEPPSN